MNILNNNNNNQAKYINKYIKNNEISIDSNIKLKKMINNRT